MKKYLFIDRDGTLIVEPEDQQVDRVEKLRLVPQVIPALLRLQAAGYTLVMVTNQDGLGTESFPEAQFIAPQQMMLDIFNSQGVEFADVHVCPHVPADRCECRKPAVGMVLTYLQATDWDRQHSYVIGDRQTDLALAEAMGIAGIQIDPMIGWGPVEAQISQQMRRATVQRQTRETDIQVTVDLDDATVCQVSTGIGFFDHMLEQIAKHAGIGLQVSVQGDLQVDDHHTVEDTALALGQALREALGDKRGIGRYGFTLPMDEALATVALDLSGRAYCVFQGAFPAAQVGALSTEMVPHFFRSLADDLQATLHITVTGDNTHHMVEGAFKGLGRTLRQACQRVDDALPSTKGVL